MHCSKWILVSVLILFTCGQALAQAPTTNIDKSTKYRTIFTVAGAGGGFTVGVFAGIAKFDDAINSDKKVWTTAILAGAGGAVGGYFVGRALDRRRDRSNPQTTQRIQVSPLISTDTKGVHLSFSF